MSSMSVMPTVDTVRGPIPVTALGTALMHEHVFVLSEELRRARPALYDEQELITKAADKLSLLKAEGVDTIVDPTVLGLGRDIKLVAEVNAKADINIVPATGLFTLDAVPYFLHFHGPGTMLGGRDMLVDLFVQDITEGISGTGIKAAFLKCAIEDALTPGVERVLVATAEAHKRTGAPITVHTSAHQQTGLIAQEIFRREGVDLGAVVIGHSGDSDDLDYLHKLIDGGSYLGMDRFGLDNLLSTDKRVATIAALCAEGVSDRLMLSHDASCHMDALPAGVIETVTPNWHHTYIHKTVLPALQDGGVTADQITTMLVDNPKRYFSRRYGQ